MRGLVIAFCLLLLSACGFQPVYGNARDLDIEVGTYLASTDVKVSNSRDMSLQKLHNAIEDRLNPTSSASVYGHAFELVINLAQQRSAGVIERNGQILRYNILLTSSYTLRDANTNEVLDTGKLVTTTSFYNADERFAAYVSEQDAVDEAVKQLAEKYRMRLASYFAGEFKLGPRSAP